MRIGQIKTDVLIIWRKFTNQNCRQFVEVLDFKINGYEGF